MINAIFSLVYRVLVRFFKVKLSYISKCKGSKKWVFISYIPEVFYKLKNEEYISVTSHHSPLISTPNFKLK